MRPPPAPRSAAALMLAAAGADPRAHPDPAARRDAAVLAAIDSAWEQGDLEAIATIAHSYDTLLLEVPAGRAERRHRGSFSTPPGYAAHLAIQALPELPAGPRVPAVVDPACGAGALLQAALARLLELGLPVAQVARALHGADSDPVAVQVCRSGLAAGLTAAGFTCSPADLAGRIVTGDALLGGTPRCPPAQDGALVWDQAFPHVLAQPGQAPEPVTGWRGGFDAVLANPPWERLKVLARDWNGLPPDGLRLHRAGDARRLRLAGRHPLTGAGELNAYLPFVETCWRLLAVDGRAAVLVPSGVASDRSSARLIETLARAGRLTRMQLIDPPAPIFSGVSARVGVAILQITGGPRRDGAARLTEGTSDPVIRVAAGLSGPVQEPPRTEWSLPASQLRLLNPNTGTTPLFSSPADAAIVTAVHRRVPVLIRRDPESGQIVDDAWSLRLVTPLHMTRDAVNFRTAPGEGLLPLWEAKHCGLLDPLGGSVAAHRYWFPEELMHNRFGELTRRGWLAGYRNVSPASAPRTLLPTPLPVAAVGNSLPLLSAPQLPLLLAALSALPVDYLLRQKHAGANVNFFKLEQIPVPAPAAYQAPAPWQPELTIGQWVLERLGRAIAWRPGLEGLRAELAGLGIPGPGQPADRPVWQPGEPPGDRLADRLLARAELDAVHAVLLGMSYHELDHALGTFTALKQRELRDLGRFGTAERALNAYRRLTGAQA